MATVRGGSVRLHVQAFVDACQRYTGASNFGTYPGHDPSIDRAVDIFTPKPGDRRSPTQTQSRVLGDAVADFTLRNGFSAFGVYYIIWRQHIFNPAIANYWRYMNNRGDDTQNHFDHNHVAFLLSAILGPTIPPPTAPAIQQGGSDLLIVNVRHGGIYLLRGDYTQHLTHPDHVLALVRIGVPYQDKAEVPQDLFNQYLALKEEGAQGIRGIMGSVAGDEGEDEDEAMPYDELVEAVQAGLEQMREQYFQEMLASIPEAPPQE